MNTSDLRTDRIGIERVAKTAWTAYVITNVNKHFQQRMSWLPQRWRTQRNAIRLANCKIKWVIKTLNASCTSFWEYVCWSVCSSPPKHHHVCLSESAVCCPLCSKQAQMEIFVSAFLHRAWELIIHPIRFTRGISIHSRKTMRRLCANITPHPCYVVGAISSSFCKPGYGNPIGPPISQGYPLNLSI